MISARAPTAVAARFPAILLGGCLAAGCFAQDEAPPPRAVWLDVDPAVMRGGHEPDDGVAMAQAFRSPEIRVTGVSVVFGNAPLDVGLPIAREIVRRFGPPGLPVHSGASGPSSAPTDASRALVRALRAAPLSVVVAGPATNVAAALREAPDIAGNIEEIVMVMGRRPGERLRFRETPPNLPDFNFELDPEAAEVLLESGAPVTLVPFGTAVDVPFDREDWSRLHDTPFGAFFRGPIDDYLDWFELHYGLAATYPFDSFAVSRLVAPDLLACDRGEAVIRSLPDDMEGADGNKRYLLRVDGEEIGAGRPPRPVLWCGAARPGLKADLLRRLGAPAG